MINKKYMSTIKKYLKKDDTVTVGYFPTEEEKEYLKKFNIKTEKVIIKQHGIVSDYFYEVEMCRYYIEK